MADIWQQFHSLPKTIRDGVATPQVIAVIDDLETRHPGVDLANVVMRVVVREFPIDQLKAKLLAENSLDEKNAAEIETQLKRVVFTGLIADYLGLTAPSSLPAMPGTDQVTVQLKQNTPPQNLPIPTVPSQPVPPGPVRPGPPASPPPMPPPAKIQPLAAPGVPLPTIPALQPISPIGRIAPTTQYSDEDAAEIDRQATRLKSMSTVNANQDLDGLSRAILTEQNVAFSDELLDRRAVSIVKARLKDIRSTPDTAAMLSREPKIGGLGLDREIALQLSVAADRYAQELKARGMVRPPDAPVPLAPPPVPRVIQAHPVPQPPVRREPPPTPLPPAAPPVPPVVTEAPRPSRPIVRPADMPAPPPVPAPEGPMVMTTPPPLVRPEPVKFNLPPDRPTASPLMTGQRMTDRPTMADVVRPSVALGPAEELRSMTLIEFRRLGQGAGDAARRLLDKFQHLQKESFAVWAEAVAGWRQSDVYLLYMAIGRESLEKAQPISQIIAERGRAGQPYLSEHEFTVLADLNRQLQM